jgi:hypothetical protein
MQEAALNRIKFPSAVEGDNASERIEIERSLTQSDRGACAGARIDATLKDRYTTISNGIIDTPSEVVRCRCMPLIGLTVRSQLKLNYVIGALCGCENRHGISTRNLYKCFARMPWTLLVGCK